MKCKEDKTKAKSRCHSLQLMRSRKTCISMFHRSQLRFLFHAIRGDLKLTSSRITGEIYGFRSFRNGLAAILRYGFQYNGTPSKNNLLYQFFTADPRQLLTRFASSSSGQLEIAAYGNNMENEGVNGMIPSTLLWSRIDEERTGRLLKDESCIRRTTIIIICHCAK